MAGFTLRDVQDRATKERDSWWTVGLVDPLARRLVLVVANRTSITPNQLTVLSLLLGLGAAACYAWGTWPFLLAGAGLYALCFLVDSMDGKLARLTDTESLFGSWMDYAFDRFRVLVCAVALMGGQYVITGNVVFAWLAMAVVFCDMLRYLDEMQVYRVRREMRSYIAGALERARATLSMLEPDDDLATAQGDARRVQEPLSDSGERAVLRHGIAVLERMLRTHTEHETRLARDVGKNPDVRLPKVDLNREFRTRFPWYQRIWEFLHARRVRTHLVSGVEFQVAVFIIAPLVGSVSTAAILWITVATGVLLLAFEAVIIYKLWLSTKDFFRVVDGIEGCVDVRPVARRGARPGRSGLRGTAWRGRHRRCR
ncbi:CDP-alcohol phosphatidyltransferase family protein [Spiractinospora alimapuensis]|uniref:CDP-alcohol phosphatidyltransferase family protein n=1 Tax=Spiractinospora alimapuensis TaxID=2820884 RepID=UPI001F3B2B6E|nr:CDP-alcohol phosphatidyltransferase family protein [Spiractinospora alimapuensis]QVQ54140.1 CDP-alcohol phosphatidyltransferase family protein [Spiractinospora alimapuensis]